MIMLIFHGRVNTLASSIVDLVVDVGGVHRREAFDDLERVAVEVAGLVEPGLVAEAHRVDDQRVAFPLAARVAHPEVEILQCGVPSRKIVRVACANS